MGTTYPSKPLAIDFANNWYTQAFVQLSEGFGISDDNKGNTVNYLKFKDGICFFAFDLSHDEDDGGEHWDLVKDG
ncbi:MAG: hypothetical protein GY696_01870 [Gammaproteobacteria bacterium]|nr:hypothetical protein [Gammaproteobacteria bacterium]